MKTYFLTGVTGVVGSALLPYLLTEADSQIYLLLRPQQESGPVRRISDLLDFIGLQSQTGASGRIHLLIGDICETKFGLSDQEYENLTLVCTHLIHCAGNVKSNLPRDEAKRIAVNSVSSLLDLARRCFRNGQLKKVDVVSTIGVAGLTQGSVTETRLDGTQHFHNSYEWAKAQAEKVVGEAMEEGLPISLHRPSMIVGGSRDGKILHFQVFYYISEFLSGTRTMGILPSFGQASLDIVPVDFVAKAIFWSCSHDESIGRILHLCSGSKGSIRLVDLIWYVRSAYERHHIHIPRKKTLPRAIFKSFLPMGIAFASKINQRRIKTLYFFLDYLNESTEFENKKTKELLGEAGITIPEVDSYIRPVLDYYLNHR